MRDSTIIFCFSDHGEGLPRAKGSALGSGHRVPFIMWIPEMYRDLTPWGSGVISDELVSFDDFGATVLALAGVEIPSYVEGVPFLPKENLEGREKKKKYVYGSCDAVDNNIELARTVTDGRYMYTRVFTPYQPFVRWIPYYDHADIQKQMRKELASQKLNDIQTEILEPRDIEYLYDLKEDRWETINLAKSQEYKHIISKMRKALTKYLIDNRDAHFMSEYTFNNYHLKESIYDLRMDNNFYPFKEILKTATLCGNGEKVIEKQIKQLTNKNDFVSYWAAIGLFTQRDNLKGHTKQIIEVLPQLKFSPSLVWASAAVLNIEESSTARECFEQVLASEDDKVAITAINALLEMNNEQAKSFMQYLEAIKEKGLKRPGADSQYMLLKQKIDGVEFVYQNYW
ncbi:MAG: sulfatase-like hydrolase/transferase [Rikenellaceae bacterium]